jgi:thiol:disulfide interchange protein
MKAFLSFFLFFFSSCSGPPQEEGQPKAVEFRTVDPVTAKQEEWSSSLFDRARQENKFVILDLGAVWCHWCHVMEETTYQDPVVLSLLHSHFILARVDQDSRPDLSNLYQDYGWPATIVFNADRGEIIVRAISRPKKWFPCSRPSWPILAPALP